MKPRIVFVRFYEKSFEHFFLNVCFASQSISCIGMAIIKSVRPVRPPLSPEKEIEKSVILEQAFKLKPLCGPHTDFYNQKKLAAGRSLKLHNTLSQI